MGFVANVQVERWMRNEMEVGSLSYMNIENYEKDKCSKTERRKELLPKRP